MVVRAFLMTAVAIALSALALSGCASTAPQRSNLQNAVYMVGDSAPLVKTSAAAPAAMESQLSVVKRVYWFFAGR